MILRVIIRGITLLWLLPGITRAQTTTATIGGFVKDSVGTPVTDASVSLFHLPDSLPVRTTKTYSDGHFYFGKLPAGSYRIRITAIFFDSYSSGILHIHRGNHHLLPVIYLSAGEAAWLKGVTITGKKRFIEQKIDRMVVHVEALVSNAGLNAFDMLENIPGVTTDENGNIILRGKTGVRILVDGKPTFLSGTDLAAYLKSLPAGQLEKVEIMTNPPANYAAAGNAGIIDIKTKRPDKNGWDGNLLFSPAQGAYNKWHHAFAIRYHKRRLNLSGNISYNRDDDFVDGDRRRRYTDPNDSLRALLLQQIGEKSHTQSAAWALASDYFPSAHTTWSLAWSGYSRAYREKGSYQTAFSHSTGEQDSTLHVDSRLTDPRWQQHLSGGFRYQPDSTGTELNISLDYAAYHIGKDQSLQNNTYRPDNTLLAAETWQVTQPSTIKTGRFKADYTYVADSTLTIDAGWQSGWSDIRTRADYRIIPGGTGDTQTIGSRFLYKEAIHAAYIQGSIRRHRLALKLGLRMEYTHAAGHQPAGTTTPDSSFKRDYLNFFPTAYLSYSSGHNGRHQWNLSLGRRISRPYFEDLTPAVFYFDKYTYFSGNPYLQPEFSNNASLSYSYAGYLTATLSYSHISALSNRLYRQVGEALVSYPANTGRQTNMSASVNAAVPVTRWWRFNLYSEFLYKQYKDNTITGQPAYIDSRSIQVSGTQQLEWGKTWSAAISSNYRGRSRLRQLIIYPSWQINATLQKKIWHQKGTVALQARDIFYSHIVQRDLEGIPGAAIYYRLAFDTRVVLLSFSYRFGQKSTRRGQTRSADDAQKRI